MFLGYIYLCSCSVVSSFGTWIVIYHAECLVIVLLLLLLPPPPTPLELLLLLLLLILLLLLLLLLLKGFVNNWLQINTDFVYEKIFGIISNFRCNLLIYKYWVTQYSVLLLLLLFISETNFTCLVSVGLLVSVYSVLRWQSINSPIFFWTARTLAYSLLHYVNSRSHKFQFPPPLPNPFYVIWYGVLFHTNRKNIEVENHGLVSKRIS